MPKGRMRAGQTAGSKPQRLPRRDRRQPLAVDGADVPRRPARAAAMRLADEVQRLEQELAAAQRQIAALEARADIDPLTDVLNRRGFEREVARSLAYVKRHGTSAALLCLDLDDFKRINDRHGHAAGDAMLRAIAMVLMRHVRASDVVARLGGDEFAVLLWNCNAAEALAKARALEAAIAQTTATHAGIALSVRASVGAAALLPLDRTADALDRADHAMYARKAERQCAVQYSTTRRRSLTR
jgi:diguanylate cyclase (GGDEF)-like protein